jgi:Domain of unknown function (DUF6306)
MVIDFRCKHHGHMLELLGEEELDVTLIDRLNELLEAERAGVDTLSRLCPQARGPEMQKLFEEVRNDEAWSCAGLVRSIKTMGGTISEKKGDFAEKVMREPTLAARLRFLNRGQGWVVKRLDALLGETLPASVGGFLEEMKTRHITNIEACERLAESLKTACDAAEVDPGYFDKDKE